MKPNSEIVVNPTLAWALIKVQSREEAHLFAMEKKSVQHLLKPDQSVSSSQRDIGMSFAVMILKRQRLSTQCTKSTYLETRFVVVTSIVCDPLFSVA